MSSPARLFNKSSAAITSSLSWQAFADPLKSPYSVFSGPRDQAQAKESVAPSQQISASAGWIPESMARWSVGMGRKYPVTMHKASFKTLSMKQV